MKPQELYKIYRQVVEIKDTLEEGEDFIFRESVKIADNLAEELFRLVGQLAAYEIENEYIRNKKK